MYTLPSGLLLPPSTPDGHTVASFRAGKPFKVSFLIPPASSAQYRLWIQPPTYLNLTLTALTVRHYHKVQQGTDSLSVSAPTECGDDWGRRLIGGRHPLGWRCRCNSCRLLHRVPIAALSWTTQHRTSPAQLGRCSQEVKARVRKTLYSGSNPLAAFYSYHIPF